MKLPAKTPAASAGHAHTLGQYLRRRRESLQPQALGFGPTRRRRVPGLRREELAQLCGVSPTWITWLEQGRPISASTQLLDRLAGALRLGTAERHYLFTLAGRTDPRRQEPRAAASAAVARLPRQLRTPAYVLDEGWNAIGWNAPAQRLFVGWLQGAGPHNLLAYTFLSPQARALVEDWPERARRLVAEFRAESARHADAARDEELVQRLSAASAPFADLWRNQTVAEREGGLRVFRHPQLGRVQFEQTTLYVATQPGIKLVVLAPVRTTRSAGRVRADRS